MSEQYEKGAMRILRYVYNQMERCRNADFDALGITSSQASVMMYLFKNRKQEVTQQGIQTALMLSHPTITGLMQRLETKGFITRTCNPRDCRCKFVELTAKGFEIERGLKNNLKSMEEHALLGLGADEIEVFEHCLITIADNLKREEDHLNTKKLFRDYKRKIRNS